MVGLKIDPTLWIRHAVLVYSFSIRSGDRSERENLGLTDLLNDYAALAFRNDVIRDMLRDNVDQYASQMIHREQGSLSERSLPFRRRIRCKLVAPIGAALLYEGR